MATANRDSLTSSFTVWMYFIYFCCLSILLKLPVQFWIEVVKVHTLVLFLILRDKAFCLLPLTMKLDVFCRCSLLSWGISLLLLVFWVFLLLWKGVGCFQIFFCVYWGDHVLYFINMVSYINRCLDVKPTLNFQSKSHLVMVCNPFLCTFVPWWSEGDWFKDTLWIPKSTDAQVPYMKWHSICI